ALPNEYLFYYLHTAEAINRITASATTRGEFLAKQQGDFYLAAEEAGGGMAGAAGAAQDADAKAAGRETAAGSRSPGESCCSSPLELWRSTLREREATYMAESRDEERREEDIAGGGYQEVALRLMTALATGRPERMILDVGNAPVGSDAPPAGRIIPELPADAVIEVLCLVDGDGVHPQPVAPVELDRLGMMAGLRASERKILEAAVTGSREAAWQGFSTHPLVSSPVLGRKLLERYTAGHPQIAALVGAVRYGRLARAVPARPPPGPPSPGRLCQAGCAPARPGAVKPAPARRDVAPLRRGPTTTSPHRGVTPLRPGTSSVEFGGFGGRDTPANSTLEWAYPPDVDA